MTAVTKSAKKSVKAKNPITAFASELYPHLGESTENSFYSPYSIETALGMCLAGAKGDTNKILAKLMKFPADPKSQIEVNKILIQEVQDSLGNPDYELRSVNALWPHNGNGFHLQPDYVRLMKDEYYSSLVPVDYVNKPKEAVDKINNWCKESTNNKIPKIIDIQFIKEDARLILTNAIYFKGKWQEEFAKNETYPEEFRGATEVKDVETMHKTHSFSYYENDNFKAIELPYKGGDLSMLVVLPHEDNAVIEDLGATYEEARNGLHYQEKVEVSLPKFKFDTDYKLSDTFQEMGAGLAFSDDADFGGISETRLKISEVIHKAFVEVDEEGTEAAAATAVSMFRCVSARMPVPPKEFKADHPFVFFIINKSGNIYFCGRVSNL